MKKRISSFGCISALSVLLISNAAGASTWNEQAQLNAPSAGFSSFGNTVALDGDTAIVGTLGLTSPPYTGAAYVFTRTGAVWIQQATLTSGNTTSADDFG